MRGEGAQSAADRLSDGKRVAGEIRDDFHHARSRRRTGQNIAEQLVVDRQPKQAVGCDRARTAGDHLLVGVKDVDLSADRALIGSRVNRTADLAGIDDTYRLVVNLSNAAKQATSIRKIIDLISVIGLAESRQGHHKHHHEQRRKTDPDTDREHGGSSCRVPAKRDTRQYSKCTPTRALNSLRTD